jgi:hypothetical protein
MIPAARMYAEQDLGQYIEWLRARSVEEFHFVLVDSRTGVSDTGGIGSQCREAAKFFEQVRVTLLLRLQLRRGLVRVGIG